MAEPNVKEKDGLIALFEKVLRDLAALLAAGAITLAVWQERMKEELRKLYALQLVAATDGDPELIADTDWKQLEPTLKAQYGYLAGFAAAIVAGITTAELAARAAQYTRASQQVFWRKTLGDYTLPAYPGEGTVCHCGCQWRIVEHADGSVDAYWERTLNDSCEICVQREHDWNPYHIDASERA
jgi:hypothetical protein